MIGIVGFMTEQIAVCTHVMEQLVALSGFFTNGECERTVRKTSFDCPDEYGHPLVREPCIFASLQDKGTKTKTVTGLTAIQYFVFGKTIPGNRSIAAANSAVITVISAVIGKFNQSPDLYIMTIILMAYSPCPLK